jgi:hypothetical protein
VKVIRHIKQQVKDSKKLAAKKAALLARSMISHFPDEEGPDLSKNSNWLKYNQTSLSSLHLQPSMEEGSGGGGLNLNPPVKVGPIDLSRSMRGAFWLNM